MRPVATRLVPFAKQAGLVAVLCSTAVLLLAQTDREKNLRTCLSGKYPSLCDHRLLTPEQFKVVAEAERRENLRICMSGKYPTLCDHSKLTSAELQAVREAEKEENLRVCLSGRYPTLCNHSLLSPAEAEQVLAAEKNENLRTCLDGRFPSLCNRTLLTPEQAKNAAAAESKAEHLPSRQGSARVPTARSFGSGCESGHWIESVAGDGKIIKLEDGSIWEVSDLDVVTSAIWLPSSEVVVCAGKIINVDDSESVGATPLSTAGNVSGKRAYLIQASHNDETFLINGEVFKARTYCFNMREGDKVLFLSGSPLGACSSAELVNLRTNKVCRVWCD